MSVQRSENQLKSDKLLGERSRERAEINRIHKQKDDEEQKLLYEELKRNKNDEKIIKESEELKSLIGIKEKSYSNIIYLVPILVGVGLLIYINFKSISKNDSEQTNNEPAIKANAIQIEEETNTKYRAPI